MSNIIPTYSIKELFENKDTYVIPIYQRNYAWGQGQVNQLIQDIYDFAFDNSKNHNHYYIGTLVVNERHIDSDTFYETIDGQQRLTTLNLLMAALHHNFKKELANQIEFELNLTFASRKKSTETLAFICTADFSGTYPGTKDFNTAIQARYQDAVKEIKRLLGNSSDKINQFYNYLVNKVQIVRVAVPEETDLNHYFEIMNNRGEQLEKHEILKAKMLEVLKDDTRVTNAFATIWEACSDMERYVQYGFTTEERHSVFGQKDWNFLACSSLDEVAIKLDKVDNEKNSNDIALSLKDITTSQFKFELNTNNDKDPPERFTSVVNFQNFLLHVLKIQTKAPDASGNTKNGKAVSLDDKRLLDFFEPYLKQSPEENLNFVKEFGFNLLKTKHLFDQFIVKREHLGDKEDWSLKKVKYYEGNKLNYVNTFGVEEGVSPLNQDILMLLSMFHVSTPTMVYKHWLNAALFYLFNNPNTDAVGYRDYLRKIAKAYLFGRYICKNGNEKEYFDIIYKKECEKLNNKTVEVDMGRLDQGTAVENFVFNYLDYLLWLKGGNSEFKFTFKSSIEHHYPQTPPDGHSKLDAKHLHNFGNLSIMSSSKNSRFTNNMPESKQKNFNLEKDIDSLKMQRMFEVTKSEGWNIDQIEKHGEEMKNVLLQEDYA